MFVRVLLSILALLSCVPEYAIAQSPPPFSASPLVKVAVNPASNKVYVVHEFDNTVTAYDESAGTSVTIPVGRRPQFVTVNPLTNRVYVDNADDSSITVIDGSTDTNLTPTALQLGTQGPITVNAPTNIIYIVRMSTAARDEVSYLNGASNEWYTIATGSYEPTAMAVNPVTNTIFVAHYATGDVRVISGTYNRDDDFPDTTSISSWTRPFAIAANPVTNKAYVITEDARGPIGIINGASKTGTFPPPLSGHARGPKSIAVNPVTNKVYAVFTDEVVVIDGATNAYKYVPIGTTGTGPASIAVNATTNKIYVATNNGSFVTIDGASDTVAGTQSIPSGAESMGINPITHTAYVFGDTLTRLDIQATTSSPVPITTTISPLPGNTSDPNPTLSLAASSGFAPHAPSISGVYYQLDSTSGAWTLATGSGPYTAALSDLAPGAHTLYAFAVDSQFPVTSTGTQSTAIPGPVTSYAFTVSGTPRATPDVSLLSSTNPATEGQSITFTASVTGTAGVAGGTVAFHDGDVAIAGCGAVTLASGSASCTTSGLTPRTHSITVAYSGDTAYRAASSSALAQIVKGSASIVLTATPNPSTTGQAVTLRVTVTGSAGVATGNVSVNENGTAVGGCGPLTLSSGSATCTVSTFGGGAHSLTASYAGDTAYAPGNSSPLSQVVKAATTTTLASSSNPSAANQPVTFMVNVAAASGTPTGSVTVSENGSAIDSCSGLLLTAGSASCTTSALLSGTHTLIATYAGDATFNGSASTALGQSIDNAKVNASLTLTSSGSPSFAGQSVTFTLDASGASGTPTGSVTFNDNATAVGTCTGLTLAAGHAQCTVALPAGAHAVNATYSGDGAYNGGTSPTVNQAVNAPKVDPTVTLSSSRNPAIAGEAVTLTVAVSGSAGNATGTVTVSDNGTAVDACTALLLSSGAASCSVSGLTVGTHALVAAYGGDGAYHGGNSPTLPQAVDPVPAATVAITSSANPSASGSHVTFTATLTGNAGTPAGFVDFLDGTSVIGECTGVAVTSGKATCSTSSLVSGNHDIAARYAGDGSYGAVTSEALHQTVEAPVANAALSLSPSSLDFGGQSMDTTSPPHDIVVTNVGSAPLQVSSIALSDAQFAASTDCATLAPAATCTVHVRFTPAVVDVPLNGTSPVQAVLSIESNASSSPDHVTLAGAAEKSLVSHYYRAILRREPDSAGQQFWQGEAARVAQLGADVNETWYALASNFFQSAEYQAFQRDDAGFLADLYVTFFNRQPDADGLAFWLDQMRQGLPRDAVLASFMFSPEFHNFTRAIFGDTVVRPEVNLAMDFYRGVLARLPDDAGFRFYVGSLQDAQCQGPDAVRSTARLMAQGFFSSAEYGNRQRGSAQYVSDLYNAVMRRGADLAGSQFYTGRLDSGATTRDAERESLVASEEFSNRVADVVAQGCAH